MDKTHTTKKMTENRAISANDESGIRTSEDVISVGSNTTAKRPLPLPLRLLRPFFRYAGRVSPGLAGRIAARMWFTPPRYQTPASEQDYQRSAVIDRVHIGEHRITTYQWGTAGPLVLLVHGWSGRGTQLGAFARPLVAAGYRVLAFDAPGHGSSSGRQTSLYEIVDVIMALAQQVGAIDSVITHSFGGMCIAYACRQGFVCRHIVMICPPLSAIGLVDKFADTLHIGDKTRQIMKQQIERHFPNLVWQQLDVASNVARLAIPGLVVHDEYDDDIPWQEGQTIARAWPGAAFVKTSGLGHRRVLRDQQVIEQVVQFINNFL